MKVRSNATLDALRADILCGTHAPEEQVVAQLLTQTSLTLAQRQGIERRARELVVSCRSNSDSAGTLDAFLQEFGLSNREGVALMCLAEALLRVPDDDTADKLIAEKISSGNWSSHKGHSPSNFVNASIWGLMLTGRFVALDRQVEMDTGGYVKKLVHRVGEPVVRSAVLQAMRIMGGQYVLGRTVPEALQRGAADNPGGTRYSFDMLGEGARTDADAQRYFSAYREAIDVVGRAGMDSTDGGVEQAHGISVKLSALHPRYQYSQRETVIGELLPRLKSLCVMARSHNMGLSIDAEECNRLNLSLDLFQHLAQDEDLEAWNGLGFVLQAYQKTAPQVADWLVELARNTNRRIMVRLVKGAYWDSEIKYAQQQGYADYPVYSRKSHTDLCYQVCAETLLSAPEQVFSQFATHNAYTVALVSDLCRRARTEHGESVSFEFQRLHGMGQLLYEQVKQQQGDLPLRVYAPVGVHKDLLPYLVRRLLENGANSSFVNRFLDAEVPVETLVQDTIAQVENRKPYRHSKIPPPPDLYRFQGEARDNARGIDLDNPVDLAEINASVRACQQNQAAQQRLAEPMVAHFRCDEATHQQQALPIFNPAKPDRVVGYWREAQPDHIRAAISLARGAQPEWNRKGGSARAGLLRNAADLIERHTLELIGLITSEAGRTLNDALSEVREAVDFCRYYALQAEAHFAEPLVLPGPTGEENQLLMQGRGVILCISPWNFPLSIFTGQVVAALASGNAVLAKPAEQTPITAFRAVQLLHEAGIPEAVLHFLPGDGARVGGECLECDELAGVVFTGSLETAQLINRKLASRAGSILPLIAETGGINTMLVDSTALPEQVVDDVIRSAFLSAGQRCSALRVLYLQRDVADSILEMLAGAIRALVLGDPSHIATDVGPVIDAKAQTELLAHIDKLAQQGRLLSRYPEGDMPECGYFVAPHVFELESIRQLPGEVFGPILHVVRYDAKDIDPVLAEINDSGFGLTLGIHTRLEGFASKVVAATRVGNNYINRDMVGAVVGVNPFGGEGLSGTGPKAGGPHYLLRLGTEKTRTENLVAKGGNTNLFTLEEE